ncbi:MAG: hypothetical protein WBG36_07450, partial [Ornithinimicrobium sp.]
MHGRRFADTDSSSASASPTPAEAGQGTAAPDGSGAAEADGSSRTRPPMAAATPVGSHTAVSSGPGAYLPATYDDNKVINTTAEGEQVARQLVQVAFDRGVDPGDVSAAAG